MLKRAVRKKQNEVHWKFPNDLTQESRNFIYKLVVIIGIVVVVLIALLQDDWDPTMCIWSDWITYSKPINAHCNGQETTQWWSCKDWYTAVKWGWSVGWYCKCDLEQVNCSSYQGTQSDTMEQGINSAEKYLDNMYLNEYSQSSIDNYNTQVEIVNALVSARNKYMSENCDCSY